MRLLRRSLGAWRIRTADPLPARQVQLTSILVQQD